MLNSDVMSRSFSGKVFDRLPGDSESSRSLVADLVRLSGDVDPNRRAVGVNVESDWRVNSNREEGFYQSVSTSLPPAERPDGVEEMLREFFWKKIRGNPMPDFLLPYNAERRRNMVNRDTWLVNVFKFPEVPEVIEPGAIAISLGGVLRASGITGLLREVFPIGSPPQYSATSQVVLEDRQRKFLATCLSRGRKPNFHPTWAGFWDELTPFVEMGPDQWLAAFGVRSERRRLCLLLRYRLKALNGGPLFMPTYLEADCNPEHFPGPAPRCMWLGSDLEHPVGGHPMSLHLETDVGPMLQEFIHEDFERDVDMVVDWGWTSEPSPAKEVERARHDHYGRLSNFYSGINFWLADPV